MNPQQPPPDWIGLRDADLTDAERHARDVADATTRSEHEAALALGTTLSRLPDPTVPLRPHRPRMMWAPAVALAATLALVLTYAATPDTSVRARGVASGTSGVVLRALAEGPQGARPLAHGDVLSVGEAVVFEAHVGTAGTLTVTEDDVVLWPVQGTWSIPAGRHALGGPVPQAWRPDTPGKHTYTATFCPDGGGPCVHDALELQWRP